MTVREMLTWLSGHPLPLAAYFGALPVVALLLGLLHGRGNGNAAPWKYLYSLLVYLACIPGLAGAVIAAYVLFFTGENLLDWNVLVTVVPAGAMAATLALVGRSANFGPLPGFGRLSGLMATIGLTFVVVLVLSRLHLLIIFGASIWVFLAAAGFVFVLLRWGAYLLFRRSDDPEVEPPAFGD